MKAKPGILARRAVHQYRRRDILGYASLRLYLRNHCALRDRWTREIAPGLVLDRHLPSYNKIFFFKQLDRAGCPEFRDLYVPGPNEILGETALLAECAENPTVFQPPPEVYSYRLSTGAYTKGAFKHYFYGFHDRHQSIARACRREPDSVVLFADIKRFYPSVSVELARKVWTSACDKSNVSEIFRLLGMKMLDNYEREPDSKGALLIGPMFSHLIGNLVLRDIDSNLATAAPKRYFRYVDDFVFVASKKEAIGLEENLKGQLGELGLDLHVGKGMAVPAACFLDYAHYFDDYSSQVSWKSFIGQLKLLMLLRPERRKEMEMRFLDAGIRIRPIDFSEVRQDWDYLSRIRSLANYFWYRKRIHRIDPVRIISEGIQLRHRFMEELCKTRSSLPNGDKDPFGRKMKISRLRYLLARLGYLAAPERLHTIANMVRDVEELAIFTTIFEALAGRDVTNLLEFGSIAAQSVAQPLKMESSPVRCSLQKLTEVQSQSYSILLLNGVPIESQNGNPENSMLTFCRGGSEIEDLFEVPDAYFRELACLHGMDEPNVLRRCLETAFDPDEEMASDIMDVLNLDYYDQY